MNKLHLVCRVRIRHQAASDQIRIEYQSNQMIRFDWLECDRRTLWSQIYYIFRNVFKYLLKWWRYLQNLIFAKQALIWIMSRSGEWLKIGIGNQILRLRHCHKIYNFLAELNIHNLPHKPRPWKSEAAIRENSFSPGEG